MTNGSSQGIFVIVALVIFGIFVLISYLLFRDTMKPSLAKIYCDAFTITSKNTGFGKLGNCGVDSENGENGSGGGSEDNVSMTYYKIRDADTEKGWSEVWVLVKKLDNGHVEIIDSGNKDKFAEGDLGATLNGDISFPDTVGNGLVIENIGVGSFRNANFANVMKLPNELIILDDYSLMNSNFSGEAKFPENLEKIGIEALKNSRFTGKMDFPDSLKEIGEGAFDNSEFEGELNLPTDLGEVGTGAFENSHFTGTPTIPSSVTSIGDNAFANSKFTGSIEIPKSVTTIGENAFANSEFTGSLTLQDGLESIGNNAFGNSKFTGKVSTPSTITSIGNNAFSNSKFTEIDLSKSTELDKIGDNAFENSEFTGALFLPNSIKTVGARAFYSSKFSNNNWTMPTKLETIGDEAFYNSLMRGTLTMNANLKTIGASAFYNSYKGNTYTVKGTFIIETSPYADVTTSDYLVYQNQIVLGKSLEYIGNRAFYNAEFGGNNEKIGGTFDMTQAPNLEYIGDFAFANSYKQQQSLLRKYASSSIPTTLIYRWRGNIVYNNNIKYIGASAFINAKFNKPSTTLPSGTVVGTNAFANAFK